MNSAPPSGRAGIDLGVPWPAGRLGQWGVARHFIAEHRPAAEIGALATTVTAH